MGILSRLEKLSVEARRRRFAAQKDRYSKKERAKMRACTAKAGIRPVETWEEMTKEEVVKYCRFYDIDDERDRLDMPCNSWLFREYGCCVSQVIYWFNKLERGEITREEYHRLVLDFGEKIKAYAAAGGSKECGWKGWDPRTRILPIDWVPDPNWPLSLLHGQ